MTTVKAAVEDLFNDPRLSATEAIDRHYGPGFRQRTDGIWDDRPEFVTRIAALREIVQHARITVLDELDDGTRYAEHHVIDLTQRDGEHILREVFVFAERDAAGRFIRLEEATLPWSTPVVPHESR
jgi:hypothetical protein